MEPDVRIRRLPEGESGKISAAHLTEKRLQALVAVYSLPSAVRWAKYGCDDDVVSHLAGLVGVSPAWVRRARSDKRVRGAIWTELMSALDEMMPDIIMGQVELAMPASMGGKGDSKAARVLLEIKSRIKLGAHGVQVNVDNRSVHIHEDGIAQDTENKAFLRELRDSGQLDRIIGTPVESA